MMRSCRLYTSVPTTTYPYICHFDGVAHRNIGFRLVHSFRFAFWSIYNAQRMDGLLAVLRLKWVAWAMYLHPYYIVSNP